MKVSMPIIPVAILIFLVLGTIVIGVAAPTEAAVWGAPGLSSSLPSSAN